MLKEIKIKIPKDNGGFEEYEVCERWNDFPTHSYFYDEKCEGCKHIITMGYGKKKFCGKSYTLVQDAIQKSKDGVETEIKKQISFHSTLESALQGYSNCRMADLVSDVDLDLKQVKEAINELREELIIYA